MNASTSRALVVVLVVVGLFVLLGGGAMTGGRMGGMGMMGTAWMGGLGWVWIPTVLTVGLGLLLVFGIFAKKQ